MKSILDTLNATLAALVLLAATGPAWADTTGGCVDSPENATLVLALLGGGVAALPWLRGRLTTRRARRDGPA